MFRQGYEKKHQNLLKLNNNSIVIVACIISLKFQQENTFFKSLSVQDVLNFQGPPGEQRQPKKTLTSHSTWPRFRDPLAYCNP